MMRSFFQFIVLFFLAYDGLAQWLIGGGSMPCNQAAEITSVGVDHSGNSVMGGYFKGNIDVDPDTSSSLFFTSNGNLEDAFLAKFDSTGTLLWSFTLGSSNGNERIQSFALDPENNIYVAGFYGGDLDADPDTGTHILIQNNSIWYNISDAFLIKYSPEGRFCWAITLNSRYNDYINAISYTRQGKIQVIGYYEDSLDFDPGPDTVYLALGISGYGDGFFASYDTSGTLNWAKRLGHATVTENMKYLAVDTSGALIIGGTFSAPLDFDPNPAPGGYTLDPEIPIRYFLAKYDATGNFLWARKLFSLSGNDKLFSLQCDQNNNIYVTGEFTDTVDFNLSNSLVTNLISVGGFDGFLAKYSSSGGYIWAKKFGHPNGNEAITNISINENDEVFLSGKFSQNHTDVDFSNSSYLLDSLGVQDIFLLKTDLNGNFQQACTLGGPSEDFSNRISSTQSGKVTCTGLFSNSIDLDPSWNTNIYTSLGSYDPFFSIYDFNLLLNQNKSDLTNDSLKIISVLPNPCQSEFTLVNHSDGIIYIELINSFGKIISKFDITGSLVKKTISVNGFASGIYYLRCTCPENGLQYNTKLIVNKN